jgi:hypothetical protein
MHPLVFRLFCISGVVMIPAILLQFFFASQQVPLARAVAPDNDFNNPPGVDIWCGKAYRETVSHKLDTSTYGTHC